MAVWVQIYYLWGGTMFLLHVYAYVCMRPLPKERSLESLGSLAVALAVAWQSGESGHYSTPPKMTSFPSFIITANPSNPSIYYWNSPIANILHMYTGKIMLSFCPDIASSTDPSPMITPYRTTL